MSVSIINPLRPRKKCGGGIIIAFTGLAGAGKTAAATALELNSGRSWDRHRFAGPLKRMLWSIGLTEKHTDGELKNRPCDRLCGKTPRWAMQTLGSEWGRDLIDPELWISVWRRSLPGGCVVVDDCRFPNEVTAIRECGGYVVRIERPGLDPMGHASERQDLPEDAVIANTGTLAELCASALEVSRVLLRINGQWDGVVQG